jgi:apolipoprotein N-acyltransferase
MIQNRKLRISLLTALPAVLFWLAWPPRDLFFLGFIAFVPLFYLERETTQIKKSGWLIYLSLLLWNIVISWWVWNAQSTASIFMMVANAGLMYIPWLVYRKSRRSFGDGKALFVFITVWLSFEYLHLNWDITWPWFMLGNIFAKHNDVVQWYEITGAMGGSLWILVCNVLLFQASLSVLNNKRAFSKPALMLLVPVIISYGFKFLATDISCHVDETFETLIVQPNIDPYLKFNKGEEVKNLQTMLDMVEQEVSDSTRYIIMPETAVVEYIDEDYPTQFRSIQLLKRFVKKHPSAHIITGVSTYNFYDKGEKTSSTARESNGRYYESYNTALEVSPDGSLDFYHKSKLVPGAEKMPYPQLFSFLEKFALDLGGVNGSLGSDKEAKVFSAGENPALAPLICYESVFPGYVSEFARKGAEILLVITNDGWWKDTDGYKQHMYYACLRAIEQRKEVLRSANTGISCRIDRLGKIHERTEWWQPTVLKVNTKNQAKTTFYAQYGDYIGRFGSFIGVFFILGLFVKRKTT